MRTLLKIVIAAVILIYGIVPRSAGAQTSLHQIRHCESEDNYEAANWNDWHVWWPGYGSHWRLGSFGAYQFGWARWHHAAHSAGYHQWAHTRPDKVPPRIQDAVARWQYNTNPQVWSCYDRGRR